jgi:hypothetical protein
MRQHRVKNITLDLNIVPLTPAYHISHFDRPDFLRIIKEGPELIQDAATAF